MKNKKSPTCALLIIGNEILSGRTEDANLTHLARRMNSIGIRFMEARVVPDIKEMIIKAINELRNSYTYVFTTGGIGPTHDDITTISIAEALNVPIKRDISTAKLLHEKYGDKITEATLKMADFPEGATLIKNSVTTAPGFHIGGIFCFAGVPRIMQVMLEAVIPLLEQGDKFFSKSVDAFIGESAISQSLEEIQNNFPRLDIGSYPFRIGGRNGTSLVARGCDEELVEKAFSEIMKMLNNFNAKLL